MVSEEGRKVPEAGGAPSVITSPPGKQLSVSLKAGQAGKEARMVSALML